jgi:hypothetical protein
MIKAVLKHLFPRWSAKKRTSRRLRCFRHVINLAAKAFLYSKEADAFKKDIESFREKSDLLKELTLWRKRGPIGKLYNIVVFICRTPQRQERLPLFTPLIPVKKVTLTIYNSSSTMLLDRIHFIL